jgi:hypothetical protein
MADQAPVRCPFCESERTELIALFGSQLLTSQYRCIACGSYFEGLRPEPAPSTQQNAPHPAGG